MADETICPTCKRVVHVFRDANGWGQPTGPQRISHHSGRQWGRPCPNGGELLAEPARAPGKATP